MAVWQPSELGNAELTFEGTALFRSVLDLAGLDPKEEPQQRLEIQLLKYTCKEHFSRIDSFSNFAA